MGEAQFSHIAALAGGLLSFFSPCVLPLAPGYLCFLAGISLEEASRNDAPQSAGGRRLLPAAIFFVLGFSSIFIALGAGAAAINPWLVSHSWWLAKIAGALILLFGVHYIGLLRFAWLDRQWSASINRGNIGFALFAYIAGLAFAFGWTPCIGPILAAILAIAATRDSLAHGTGLLATYSLGLGIPFLLAAALLPAFLATSKAMRRHLPLLRVATGGLLATTGILIFTGGLESLAWWSLRLFPFLGNLG